MIKTGIVAQNKKARFHYEILDTYEAGLVLTGPEVKSLREGHATISESYAQIKEGKAWLINAHIQEFKGAYKGFVEQNPTRPRALLLQAKELVKISKAVQQKGNTLIPLEIYFNDRGLAKVRLAVGKGKTYADKRDSEKERDWNKDKRRILAHYNNGKKG